MSPSAPLPGTTRPPTDPAPEKPPCPTALARLVDTLEQRVLDAADLRRLDAEDRVEVVPGSDEPPD